MKGSVHIVNHAVNIQQGHRFKNVFGAANYQE
jgi:hypothetical protein